MYWRFVAFLAAAAAISILVGCAPKPSVDVYMEPVGSRDQAELDAQARSITVEQRGVRITLEPLDEVEIFHITQDARINPYIAVDRWGNVRPMYTVFGLRVENTGDARVVIDSPAVLVDQNGEQFGSLPYSYFKDLYENVEPRTVVFYDIGYRYYYPYPRSFYYSPYRYYYRYPYSYRGYPPYRAYDYYPDINAVNHAKMVVRETIFDDAKLFPGAKRDGLLVFERLDIGASEVRVILPDVQIFDKEKQRSKVDFEFEFRQVVNVRE
jgi:hypothetical protein